METLKKMEFLNSVHKKSCQEKRVTKKKFRKQVKKTQKNLTYGEFLSKYLKGHNSSFFDKKQRIAEY